jgi:hypothetical protein
MLEAHDCVIVIGVPDYDNVTRGLAPTPAFGPEVEDIMKIPVGPVTTKLCKVAIRGDRCGGSASAS